MKTISKLILLTSLLTLSCGNKDDIDSFLKVDFTDFNQRIKRGIDNNEEWVKTPLLIVNQLFGPTYNPEGYHTFIFEQYENDNSLTVIVTQEGHNQTIQQRHIKNRKVHRTRNVFEKKRADTTFVNLATT